MSGPRPPVRPRGPPPAAPPPMSRPPRKNILLCFPCDMLYLCVCDVAINTDGTLKGMGARPGPPAGAPPPAAEPPKELFTKVKPPPMAPPPRELIQTIQRPDLENVKTIDPTRFTQKAPAPMPAAAGPRPPTGGPRPPPRPAPPPPTRPIFFRDRARPQSRPYLEGRRIETR